MPQSTGRDCRMYQAYNITKADQDLIIKQHNDFRNMVASGRERRGSPGPQPAARSIAPLVRMNFN